MEGDVFAEAARWLRDRSRIDPSRLPPCLPLGSKDAGPVMAVDGSHAVLAQTGAAWVVAVRAAAVRWPGPDAMPAAPEVVAVAPENATDRIAQESAKYGLDASRVGSAEAFAEALRTLRELEASLEALRQDTGMVLVDGALEHLASPAQPLADLLLAAAEQEDTCLVGVAKRSRLSHEGIPLVAALRRHGPPGRWMAPVPDYRLAHIARLHPDAAHVFRIDITRPQRMPEVAALARDAVYLGYPYPLALAHNTVAFTGTETAALRGRLEDAIHETGDPWAALLLDDFHDTLDRNIP